MVASRRRTLKTTVSRYRGGRSTRRSDLIAAEEPLEVRLSWKNEEEWSTVPVAVTMRTPGDDFELAAGFLFSEGILHGAGVVADIAYCGERGSGRYNVVTVRLREGASFDPRLLSRNFYVSSSCGVCGKASLEAVEIRGAEPFRPDEPTSEETAGAADLPMDAAMLASLPEALRESQKIFESTGGLHAAGLFRGDGSLELVREDVGRHNAVDKIVGKSFLEGGLPLGGRVLLVSGRASFEIIQKALAAGIPFVAAVGAPSSLAVELAKRFRMTLAGFVRDAGFNLYSEPGRVS